MNKILLADLLPAGRPASCWPTCFLLADLLPAGRPASCWPTCFLLADLLAETIGGCMNKILLFLAGLFMGLILGFAMAAWALYEPIHVGPAKYGFNPSPGPVPPYTMDGARKITRIECISESAKDCPQPVAIPAPGTLWLMLAGLGGIAAHKKPAVGMGP